MSLQNLYKNVHFIAAVLTIASIYVAAVTASKIGIFNINPSTNFGVCSTFFSGTHCSYDTNILCGTENLQATCENKGDARLDLEIYNKGLFLATDVEITCRLIGADFGLSYGNYSFGYYNVIVDGSQVSSSRTLNISGVTILSYNIHTIKPNEVKTISFRFPSEFGFYKRPYRIEIKLKENGVEKLTKIIYVKYFSENRSSCYTQQTPPIPYPLSGILISNGAPQPNINITIKDLQTKSEQSFSTASDGSFAFDLSNFDKCWENGDIIELKYCRNETCNILGYRELREHEYGILLDFAI